MTKKQGLSSFVIGHNLKLYVKCMPINKRRSSLKDFFPFNANAAILLSAFTVLAYLCTYIFERSYCVSFNIPTEFISIDLNVLLPFWTIAIVLVFIIITITIAGYITLVTFKAKQKLYNFLLGNFILLWSFIILLYWHPEYRKYPDFYFEAFCVFNIILGIIIFALAKKKSTHEVPDEKREPLPAEYNNADLNRQFQTAINIFLVTFAIIIGAISDEVGKSAAKNKQDFYVFSDNKNVVVIRIYGDKIICKQLDTTKKKLRTGVIVIRNDAEHPLKLDLMHFGQLANGNL